MWGGCLSIILRDLRIARLFSRPQTMEGVFELHSEAGALQGNLTHFGPRAQAPRSIIDVFDFGMRPGMLLRKDSGLNVYHGRLHGSRSG